MRHNALFRRFISALTRGGPGGLPRPIEVHAHDPLRYVGDMLGWLHQVSVRDESFVGVCVKLLLDAIFLLQHLLIMYLIVLCCTCMQALASERELVLVLLDPDALVDTGPTAKQFSNSFENGSGKTESDITFVLDRIFEGVCRPFKVRVEQVLQSQPSLIVSYKLSNTLEFYSYTVSCHQIFFFLIVIIPYIYFYLNFIWAYRSQICLDEKLHFVIHYGC